MHFYQPTNSLESKREDAETLLLNLAYGFYNPSNYNRLNRKNIIFRDIDINHIFSVWFNVYKL